MELSHRLSVALRDLTASLDRLESAAGRLRGPGTGRAELLKEIADLRAEREQRIANRADDARRIEALVRANADVEARLSGIAKSLRTLAADDRESPRAAS